MIEGTRDAILRASWVFSYAAILLIFRLLQTLEGANSQRGTK